MSVAAALAGALLSLYALGLPLALMLPAPQHSVWVLRIAVAPLLSMVTTAAAGALLTAAHVPLSPWQLVAIAGVMWALAWRRTGREWGLRASVRHSFGPILMVVTSLLLWYRSLSGFGLYLPNRDFKNHAYFVAQVAWTRSTDITLILRPSPISDPESANFYPLGLHTLLGWTLPSPDASSVAITAAAAVLVTSISMPLAMIALARMWRADSVALSWVAGFAGVLFIALGTGFALGSVVLLVAAALYPAALAVLWYWAGRPTALGAVGLVLAAAGLLVLHVAEAIGLALVALTCLPKVWRARGRVAPTVPQAVTLLVVLVASGIAVLVMAPRLVGLLGTDLVWDLQPNTEDPVVAAIVAAGQVPGGTGLVRAAWVLMALVGFSVAYRQRLSAVPLAAFAIPVGIGVVAGAAWTPGWVNVLTAPWYGSAGRVGPMALAPVALAAALTLVTGSAVPRVRALRWVALGLGAVLFAALAAQVVPTRRTELAGALAGAGDTAAVARSLKGLLGPDDTVLTFEGDGTAMLFAHARIPVTAGLEQDPAVGDSPAGGEALVEQLRNIADPAVRQRFADLGISHVAVGTTARYWGSEPAYVWQELLRQPELTLALEGTDMVVLALAEEEPR